MLAFRTVQRSVRPVASSRSVSTTVPGAAQLAALFKEQGHSLCDPAQRQGLHPLVLPIAAMQEGNGVLGVLRWPSFGEAEHVVVRTERQPLDLPDGAASLASLTLQPFGSLSQYARRAAAEAESAGGSVEATVSAAAELCAALSAPAYSAGELGASKLTLDQYLLLRVGPFPDVWEVRAPLTPTAIATVPLPMPMPSRTVRPCCILLHLPRLLPRRSAWR